MGYVFFGALAVIAFMLGWWGRRNVKDLASRTSDSREQMTRERTMRRGAIACQMVSAVLVLVIVLHAAGASGF